MARETLCFLVGHIKWCEAANCLEDLVRLRREGGTCARGTRRTVGILVRHDEEIGGVVVDERKRMLGVEK